MRQKYKFYLLKQNSNLKAVSIIFLWFHKVMND